MAKHGLRPRILSGPSITALAVMLDSLLMIGSGLALYAGYVGWDPYSLGNYSFTIISASALMVAIFNRGEWYDPYRLRHLGAQLRLVLRVVAGIACFLIVLAFAFKVAEFFSRVWAFSWLMCCVVLLSATRIFWARYIARAQRQGAFRVRLAIVGATEQAASFLAALGDVTSESYILVGAFDDREPSRHEALGLDGGAASLEALEAAIRRGEVDEVVLALPCSADERIRQLLNRIRTLPVAVHLIPNLANFLRSGTRFSYLEGIPILELAVRPIGERDLLLKSVCDRLFALGALIALLPLMTVVAVAIKLDSRGPVLFRQTRYGFNNSTFDVKKFRTMTVDACAATTLEQAVEHDPRVTRVGRFLRKTSLDELPQLFNVLEGSMSLVGPRPHAAQHHVIYEERIANYSVRHKVKPGITGWAQVNGLRGETETDDKMAARVALDTYYIDNWSLWLDIKILAKTAFVVLFQQAAY